MHFLVIGVGSVGKRHIGNLIELDHVVSIFDVRQDRLDEANDKYQILNTYCSFEQALEVDFDGVIIASPTKYHVEQCKAAIIKNIPVFLEKPLSIDFEEAKKLKEFMDSNGYNRLMLGYTYRWWKPLNDMKNMLDSNRIGKPLHAKFIMSAHLEDWHPWERYQDFFMSKKELGGGALLDESHFIDLMYYFFSSPSSVYGTVEKISSLDIDSDDNVDILIEYPNGLRVYVHLDLFGRPHEKYISITGENGTLEWSFEPNQIKFSNVAIKEWKLFQYDYVRNDMFVNAIQSFTNFIKTGEGNICTITDGINVMEVIDAVRLSQKLGKKIRIR